VSSHLSTLPSVDRLLNSTALREAQDRHGRERVVRVTREHLSGLHAAYRHRTEPLPACETIAAAICESLDATAQPSLRKVINLSGTVLHTNLGRALLPKSSAEAVVRAATQFCNIEFDVDQGERGERDEHVEETLKALTGAQAAAIVNNNAAALFLVLNTLALRGDVVVSRGELVEIGGQFRIPEIMTRAGARLREVGTTNRTHLSDYADAIGPRTALLLKVHTSNYEIRGFTASVDIEQISALGRERSVPVVHDLGSGTLLDLRRWDLPYEPTVRESLEGGADLVTFSGDKLLGGPQCGVIAGRQDLIERLRKNPLRRALRVDKLVIAALDDVLRLYLHPERLAEVLPTLRFLARDVSDTMECARRVAEALAERLPRPYSVEVARCDSQVGSGAFPARALPSAGVRISCAVALKQRDREIQRLSRALRSLSTPIIGRVEEHALLLDCRCLLDPKEVIDQATELGRMLQNA